MAIWFICFNLGEYRRHQGGTATLPDKAGPLGQKLQWKTKRRSKSMAEGTMRIMAKTIPPEVRLLTLPLTKANLILAGYKASKYLATHKTQHYSWNMGSISNSWPLQRIGKGKIIAAGMDGANNKDCLGIPEMDNSHGGRAAQSG